MTAAIVIDFKLFTIRSTNIDRRDLSYPSSEIFWNLSVGCWLVPVIRFAFVPVLGLVSLHDIIVIQAQRSRAFKEVSNYQTSWQLLASCPDPRWRRNEVYIGFLWEYQYIYQYNFTKSIVSEVFSVCLLCERYRLLIRDAARAVTATVVAHEVLAPAVAPELLAVVVSAAAVVVAVVVAEVAAG